VLNSLTSKNGQRTYDHAMNEFVDLYCSEPRVAFNRTVVLRHRIHLRQHHLAPTKITSARPQCGVSPTRSVIPACSVQNLPPGSAESKAYAESLRLGNWLTADQGRSLLLNSEGDSRRSKRNYAILALLIGCGLRRGELLASAGAQAISGNAG
jgi:hypothetical protein